MAFCKVETQPTNKGGSAVEQPVSKATLGLVIFLQAKKTDIRPATTCARLKTRIASCVLTRDRGLKEVGSRKK